MSKIKVIITGAGGGGANNIISTIKEREKYTLIGFDISEFKVARANVDFLISFLLMILALGPQTTFFLAA